MDIRAKIGTQIARWVFEEAEAAAEAEAQWDTSETYKIMSQVGGIHSAHQGLLFAPHSFQAQIIWEAIKSAAPDQRVRIGISWGIADPIGDGMPEQGYPPAVWRGTALHRVVECWNADAFMAFRDLVLIAMFEALVHIAALGEVLTVSECATRYALEPRTVRYACVDGRVKARKTPDGAWLVQRQSAKALWG
ncbi:hypothetical protein FBQ95_17020 [Chloroflexi bacterium CFX3]|nr:hypothetical protein [Chloroflexi bacterium CFX3]